MSQLKILIIDDEPDLLDALSQLLEMKSFTVFATTECNQALQACKEQKFDVVLSHWFDHRQNIEDTLKAIRHQLPDSKQIVMTGSLNLDSQIESQYSVIYKPFTVEDLVIHIEKLFFGKETLS